MNRLLICVLVIAVALSFVSADDEMKGTRALVVAQIVKVKPGMGIEYAKYMQKVMEANKKLDINFGGKVLFCIAGPANEVIFTYSLSKDVGKVLRTEGGMLKRLVKVFGKEEALKIWKAGAACVQCMERRLYVEVGQK